MKQGLNTGETQRDFHDTLMITHLDSGDPGKNARCGQIGVLTDGLG